MSPALPGRPFVASRSHSGNQRNWIQFQNSLEGASLSRTDRRFPRTRHGSCHRSGIRGRIPVGLSCATEKLASTRAENLPPATREFSVPHPGLEGPESRPRNRDKPDSCAQVAGSTLEVIRPASASRTEPTLWPLHRRYVTIRSATRNSPHIAKRRLKPARPNKVPGNRRESCSGLHCRNTDVKT